MKILEMLASNYYGVIVLNPFLSRVNVAKISLKMLESKYGNPNEYGDPLITAIKLLATENSALGFLLQDENVRWSFEVWPRSAVRMTRMCPPSDDAFGVNKLLQQSKKRVAPFARSTSSASRYYRIRYWV